LINNLALSLEQRNDVPQANQIRIDAAKKYNRVGDPKSAAEVLNSAKLDEMNENELLQYRQARLNLPEVLPNRDLQQARNSNQFQSNQTQTPEDQQNISIERMQNQAIPQDLRMQQIDLQQIQRHQFEQKQLIDPRFIEMKKDIENDGQ
jgi:hypothetical protein